MRVALVVDGSEIVRKIAARIFEEDMGFVAIEAASGAEAKELLKKGVPELALVDWQLPDMDTLELIAHMRSIPEAHAMKIAYATTVNDELNIETAIEAGANAAVLKPFERLSLRELMVDLKTAA